MKNKNLPGDKILNMENKPTSVEELFYKLRDYGDTRIELFKLKSLHKITGVLSSLIVSVILIGLLSLIILCFTIGFAILLGAWLGKMYYGFFIMAIIYIIIGLILYSGRNKFLSKPVSDKIIKELLD